MRVSAACVAGITAVACCCRWVCGVTVLCCSSVCAHALISARTSPLTHASPRAWLPAAGGLSLQEVQLAGPLAFGGLCLISISLFVYPRLQRLWGTLPLTRRGLLLAVAVSLVIPCARFAAAAPAAVGAAAAAAPGRAGAASAGAAEGGGGGIGLWPWVILYVAMLFKSAAGCAAFTGAMVMVNALASPEQLGAVNGVGQSLAALARGIGPAMGGLLWGVAVHIARPGAQLLPYGAVACCALLCWLIFVHVRPLEGEEVDSGSSGTGGGSTGSTGSGSRRYKRLHSSNAAAE